MGFTYLLTHIHIRMKITLLKAFVFLLFVFLQQNGLAAQNRALKGTITDAEDSSPMIGVTVLVVGTGIGTVTDLDGTYAIQVATGQTLRYSYTGYKPKEIKITNETLLDVQLIAEATALGEIVVTALGIKEEKKKLAYSIQEVKGEALQNTGRDNFIVSDDIREKVLIFNEGEMKQLELLRGLLMEERMKDTVARLESKGLPKGINVLLFGRRPIFALRQTSNSAMSLCLSVCSCL
jgi:hypothetical protein